MKRQIWHNLHDTSRKKLSQKETVNFIQKYLKIERSFYLSIYGFSLTKVSINKKAAINKEFSKLVQNKPTVQSVGGNINLAFNARRTHKITVYKLYWEIISCFISSVFHREPIFLQYIFKSTSSFIFLIFSFHCHNLPSYFFFNNTFINKENYNQKGTQ